MSRDVARRRARGRAAALACTLRGDISGLLSQANARGRSRAGIHLPPATGARPPASLVREMRSRLGCIDDYLTFGLDFDFAPDAELRYRRAHVRNAVIMIRRNVESALLAGEESVFHSDHLAQAGRFVEELIETVGGIEQRLLAIEADAPDDSWSRTWSATVLAIASSLLPSHRRREFLEDQCGNLTLVSSRSEWARYMLDLLLHMPQIAAAAHVSGDPASQPPPGQ